MVTSSLIVARGALQRARAASVVAKAAISARSSLLASSARLQHYPCHHAYRFASSAQPSIAEVDAATATRSDRLVSHDDVHKEEKKRGRLSDVSSN